jgi:crotonobetainyl-CoA:carnitine CoA-transferase CaiB-like acyl-CoA transferase
MVAEINCPPIPETMRVAGVPVKFTETPGGVYRQAPRQGEHTDEVLLSIGFTSEDLVALREQHTIQ